MENDELFTIIIEVLGVLLMLYCLYFVFAKPKKTASPIGIKTLVAAIAFLIITIIFINVPMVFYVKCSIGIAILFAMFFFMRKTRSA